MSSNAQGELNSIKSELQSIINELDDISNGIRIEFSNIGNDTVAQCVSRVADTYRDVKKMLDRVNVKNIRQKPKETKNKGGGGSAGGGGSSRRF